MWHHPALGEWESSVDRTSHGQADAARRARAALHGRVLPALTRTGFRTTRVPDAIFAQVASWYRKHADRLELEEGVGSIVRLTGDGVASSLLRLDHTSALARAILDGMQPVVEAWCGEPLVATSIYGVRVYHRGATLAPHVDHLETHVASAVLLVAQECDAPWPLVLHGPDNQRHEVTLTPGEALLYEGARLTHERDRGLMGDTYAALFIHYRPTWWAYTAERVARLDARRPLRALLYGQPEVAQAPIARSGGFLAFQPDYGGWNNVLMHLEVMVGLAWLTGRTLVLPPPKRHYLLGEDEHALDAFLDLGTLQRHLPVLSADDFAARRGIEPFADYAAFSDWMASNGHAPGWNALDDILAYPEDAPARRPELAERVGSRRVVYLDDAITACDVLYFPMTIEHRMFGVAEAFFLLGDKHLHARLRRVLRDALRYRPEIVALAEEALGDPALGVHFGALHVRRGDFQYAETRIDAAELLAHTRGLYEPGTTLYLATDHDDPTFFAPLRAAFHIVTFRDLDVAAATPPHWVGIVETLICAAASAPFAGTRLSTFSARIATLRGHLALTPAGHEAGVDDTLYFTQPPLDAGAEERRPYPSAAEARLAGRAETTAPWWESARRVPLWGRTYAAIWRETDDAPQEVADA